MKIILSEDEDYQRFCMIKDDILLNNSNFLIKKPCCGCTKIGHSVGECPVLHYIPNKERIVHVYANANNCQKSCIFFRRKKRKTHALKNLKENIIRLSFFLKNLNSEQEVSEKDANAENEEESEKKIMMEFNQSRNTVNNSLSYIGERKSSVRKLEKDEIVENFEAMRKFKNYYPKHNFSQQNFEKLVRMRNHVLSSMGESFIDGESPKLNKKTEREEKTPLMMKRGLYSSKLELKEKISFLDLVKLVMSEPKLRKQLRKKKY